MEETIEPMNIRRRPRHSTAVALLESHGLPTSDITDAHLEYFFYAGDDGSPSGIIGLEIYDSSALLRSLVVAEDARGQGVGSALTLKAEQFAASKNIRCLYLLTTTAETFFSRLGYERIDRSAAPAAIVATAEFSQLCPASSAFMYKSLWPSG
jgi:amino-acid N-acetyltransferase